MPSFGPRAELYVGTRHSACVHAARRAGRALPALAALTAPAAGL